MSDRVFEKLGFPLKRCGRVDFLDLSFTIILCMNWIFEKRKGFWFRGFFFHNYNVCRSSLINLFSAKLGFSLKWCDRIGCRSFIFCCYSVYWSIEWCQYASYDLFSCCLLSICAERPEIPDVCAQIFVHSILIFDMVVCCMVLIPFSWYIDILPKFFL